LRWVPVIGWGMRFFEFIFLKRDWQRDQHTMTSMLDLIVKDKEPAWLLIFPEGMNPHEMKYEKRLLVCC
jgi:lysocardiolipin and lysophospholipid acyltransferase